MGKLYVVRHAHAGSRGPDDAADRLRGLSDRGSRQALALADQLVEAGVTRLVASPFTRCMDTLVPLGERLGITVESDERLAEAQGFKGALELAEELGEETAVMCSHGDVIPDLLEELARRGVSFQDDMRWQKASTWVLSRHGGGFSKARYLPPPV